jgi:hypothetical protein
MGGMPGKVFPTAQANEERLAMDGKEICAMIGLGPVQGIDEISRIRP